MHPVNKNRLPIVQEEIQKQFVDLIDRKGQEIKKEVYTQKVVKVHDNKPSIILMNELLRKINVSTDLQKIANLSKELIPHINKKYEYIRIIGKGGEAIVILVKDTFLDSLVALKVAKPNYQGKKRGNIWNFSLGKFKTENTDQTIKLRFLRGAKLQRQLSGTTDYGYIPSVYNILEYPLCVEMEFSPATNFYNFIKNNELEQNINIFFNVLAFINEIHSFGVIHRDLKPDNILITNEGVPVLLDFTTSKQLGGDDNLTGAGYQIGTKLWCSPRQMLDAGRANYQDDIFSLGLLLYVIVTKELPEILTQFNKKKNELEYLENLESTKGKTKYINRLKESLDAKWQGIFEKATAIHEKNRYEVIEDFIKDLKKVMGIYESTEQKKATVDDNLTVQGSNCQYKDLEKRLLAVENKLRKINEVTKGLYYEK